MKTLLIRPFTDTTKGDSPPLSLMYLSSALKRKSLNVRLFDNCVDRKKLGNLSLKNKYVSRLLEEISTYKPDLLGMTLFSGELNDIYEICRLIKQNFVSLAIVLGGPHATAMPDETLAQMPECDFVVRGEGENILSDLIAGLSENRPLKKVRGLSFRENGNNRHCENADIIRDLDDLPFPDRESLIHHYRNGDYRSLAFGMPADTLATSRGCPFNCHFCSKVCRIYRSRSARNVLDEIEWVVKNISPQHIQIVDDSFTIEKERCTSILSGIIERNYHCRFSVRSRVNAVDQEVLELMKRAGVKTIIYGLESGSQTMLDAFNKKTTVSQNVAACRLARKAGLNCIGNMLLFYPGENRETLKETNRFIRMAKPTVAKYLVVTPLPQTKLYLDAKKKGRLVGDWKVGEKPPWIKLDEFDNLAAMEKIARKMFLKAFFNPMRLYWIFSSYGQQFFRSPAFSLKMLYLSLRAKIKY
ncbi:MAG: cobalamin-dependent protein [Candidatus Zixiibacteriota bacterium]|nr:MAG: cobalamin-dependent protein [candidate division Zixibacteria bacterium]